MKRLSDRVIVNSSVFSRGLNGGEAKRKENIGCQQRNPYHKGKVNQSQQSVGAPILDVNSCIFSKKPKHCYRKANRIHE